MRLAATDVNRPPIEFRWMNVWEIEQAVSIEEANFTDPWPSRLFRHYFRERFAIVLAAECKFAKRMIGYVVYERMGEVLHIHRLAVHAARQRQGVGRRIFQHIAGKLDERTQNLLQIHVPESDTHAQLWLRACGAKCDGIIRADGGNEYRFVVEVPTSKEESK